MTLIQYWARTTKLINLFGEFPQVNSTFVINTDIIKKSCCKTVFPESHGKIGIFADAHFRKTTNLFESRFSNAHIKTSRLKFANRFLTATNSACGKNGSHGIGNCFLHQIKTFVGFVGATKSVT